MADETKPPAPAVSGSDKEAADKASRTDDSSVAATSDDGKAKRVAVPEAKGDRRRPQVSKSKIKQGSDAVRSRVASAVWLLAVLAALILAVGALLVALDANQDNSIVKFLLDAGHKIDGPFWKVFTFEDTTKNGAVVVERTKEYLANWGLAAVAYLIGGRILDRIIRP